MVSPIGLISQSCNITNVMYRCKCYCVLSDPEVLDGHRRNCLHIAFLKAAPGAVIKLLLEKLVHLSYLLLQPAVKSCVEVLCRHTELARLFYLPKTAEFHTIIKRYRRCLQVPWSYVFTYSTATQWQMQQWVKISHFGGQNV